MFSSRRRLLLLACLCAGAFSLGLRSPPLARHGKLHARLVLPSWKSKSLISGLLNIRQQCTAGESDCEDECCPTGYYCDPPGCCPDGDTCDGIVDGCPTSGEVQCGFDTCCRTGQTCTSDLECVDGGGGGGSVTSSAPTSVPSAPAGSHNVVIDVSTNADITWEGHWASGPSSCASGGTAMLISGTTLVPDAWMSYDFTGTAIYVSLASNNAEFGITLDDDEVLYIGDNDSQEPSNCTFGWHRTGLSAGTHNLFIDPLGSKFNPNEINPPWYFELQNFVIVKSNSATPQDPVSWLITTVMIFFSVYLM